MLRLLEEISMHLKSLVGTQGATASSKPPQDVPSISFLPIQLCLLRKHRMILTITQMLTLETGFKIL